MSITLTYNGTTLELPPDLVWADEFTWLPVRQEISRSTAGTLLVDVAVCVGGRPITLRGESNSAWITRADLKTVVAWAALPGQQFTLSLHDSSQYTVIFNHGNGDTTQAIGQEPVVDFCDAEDSDYYCGLALRFLEI